MRAPPPAPLDNRKPYFISAQSNARYLEALSQVHDPTPAVRDLDALTSNASTKDGRTVRAINPLARTERMLFEVLLAGEHALHGFTNRDLRGDDLPGARRGDRIGREGSLAAI